MNRIHPARAKLKGHPLVREFEPSELDELLDLSEPRRFPADHEICRQGDHEHSLFLLMEGEARAVVHQTDGSEMEVAKFGVGDIFGEFTLLDNQPRNVDVIATTDCTIMSISTALLRMLGLSAPRAAFKLTMAVLELVGRRLRSVNQRYVDSLHIVSALSAERTVMSAGCVA